MAPLVPCQGNNTFSRRSKKKTQKSSDRTKAPDMFEELKEVYNAISNGNWEFLIEHYKNHPEHLLCPMNINRDSAFHLAVYSKEKKPFVDLFKIVTECVDVQHKADFQYVILSKNSCRNSILHEAATVGNLEVIKYLIHDYPRDLVHDHDHQVKNNNNNIIQFEMNKELADKILNLLESPNLLGEVPLFRAAAYGKTRIVEVLAKQKGQRNEEGEIPEDNRTRYDGKSILQIAIEGEHFDTALLLLNIDPSLARITNEENGMTAFHILAHMPTSFKSGHTVDGYLEHIFYYCFPVQDTEIEYNDIADSTISDLEDLESGHKRNPDNNDSLVSNSRHNDLNREKGSGFRILHGLWQLILQFLQGWSKVDRIWREKRKHKFALKLANRLTDLVSWEHFESNQFKFSGTPLVPLTKPTPLYIATKNGITEIIREILRVNPQAVEQENELGQNILHVAVMHRREEIYYLLKEMGTPWVRITRTIDDNGYTLLHRVADTQYYTGGTKPGPALQLQEELQWFDRVKRAVPSYYAMLRVEISEEKDDLRDCANEIINILKKHKIETTQDNGNIMVTPKEIFERRHKKQLEEAQIWIKETSQSCSTVAVLVATVVFAAAYTIPGGTNDRGFPIFQNSPYFYFFTVMDVIALACSLTSVVAFLSILTSPFEFHDFHHSIPQKLSFGFTLLFFSVITTMLAFGATILLVIRAEKNWTASLISIAAFLPVSVFVVLQFRLYWTLIIDFFQSMRKVLRCLGISSQYRKRKQLLYIH